MKVSTAVKSVKEILGLLGEQMDAMRPQNKPSEENIKAAGKTASLTNSYLGTVRLAMEAAKSQGTKPDLASLGFATKSAQIAG